MLPKLYNQEELRRYHPYTESIQPSQLNFCQPSPQHLPPWAFLELATPSSRRRRRSRRVSPILEQLATFGEADIAAEIKHDDKALKQAEKDLHKAEKHVDKVEKEEHHAHSHHEKALKVEHKAAIELNKVQASESLVLQECGAGLTRGAEHEEAVAKVRHAEHEVESTSSEHQRAAAKVEEQKMKLQAIESQHHTKLAEREQRIADIHSQRGSEHLGRATPNGTTNTTNPYDNAGVAPAANTGAVPATQGVAPTTNAY